MANDLGYIMQRIGMLKTYEWDVSYSMSYTEE